MSDFRRVSNRIESSAVAAIILVAVVGVAAIAFAAGDGDSATRAAEFIAVHSQADENQSSVTRPNSERPTLTPAEYAAQAAELRLAYSKPPAQWPAAELEDHPDLKFAEIGRLPREPRHPETNPFTKDKAALGKQLFFDPRLSGSLQIACASCHDPDLGWADGRTVAFGHDRQAGARNTPTIMNSAFNGPFFWDGRASSLESQARQPVINEIEMHSTPDLIAERVNKIAGYRESFKKVFGVDEITFDEIAKAIACFERTIVGGRSKFDAFLDGKTETLSDAAVRGLHLFRTTARCINCHNGVNFTDNQFHNLGLSYYGRKFEDLGRYVITKKPEDVGRFKTPSLRNVTNTAPYMHNGLFELEGALNIYNAGGFDLQPRNDEQKADPLFPKKKSALLKKLNLNDHDLADLTEFLESLAEPKHRIRPPELPK
jgi:cytochrome c peroxidase